MRNAILAATVATASLLVSAGSASAQPAMTAPFEPAPAPAPEVKSASTATLLAIGTTIGGVALMSSGVDRDNGGVVLGGTILMLIGPSAGHFYAGETGHGVKMSLLRTGAAVVLGAGLLEQTMAANCDVSASGGGCSTRDSRDNGEKLMWIGGGTLVAATVYDLWDAHNAANRANEKAARSWNIGPSMMAGASGTTVPALTVAGSW